MRESHRHRPPRGGPGPLLAAAGRDLPAGASVRRSARSTAGIAAVLTLVLGAAMLGAVRPADALFGQAVINPIESNLAEKFWASATASSGQASAEQAIDQDADTAWVAADSAAGQWLSLDLGGSYDNVRKVQVVFPDSAAYRYVVEASGDGEDWDVVADRSAATTASRGAVHLLTRPDTRHVRVTIAGTSPGATVGIAELKAFNYLRDDIILGADLSYVDDFQTRDYWVHPLEEDRGAGPRLLDVVQDRGMEYIRLRIFNEPRSESTGNPNAIPRQGPERSAVSAQWIAERGLGLGIDFHYADSWADPGKQPKPRAWAELPFDQLVTALHDYTHDYLTTLVDQGTPPDKVAVGNEINNGFLWGSEATNAPAPGPVIGSANPAYFRNQAAIYQSQPGGGILWQYWGSEDPAEQAAYEASWDRFTTLLAAGIAAVREATPDAKVELHSLIGSGVGERTGLEKAIEYWDQLLARVNAKGQDPDVLGFSFYPEWHSTIEAFEFNLHTVANRYPGYEIDIPETAYPASGGGGSPQPNSTYPRTIQGQADAIQHVFKVANDIVDNRGSGVLTWEPASYQTMFRQVPGMANTWEPHASIDIYNKSHATHVLEHTVYVDALLGNPVTLPATVDVLTTADGSVEAVPVDWDEVPEDATAAPGQLVVTGETAHGEVTAVIDVGAGLLTARAGLDALVAAGGVTPAMEERVRHALAMFEDWIQNPRQRGPALSHLDRAVRLLEWQADVVDRTGLPQGDPAGLRALAATIRALWSAYR